MGCYGIIYFLLGMLIVFFIGVLVIFDLIGVIIFDFFYVVVIFYDLVWFILGMIVLVDGIYEEEEEFVGKGLFGSLGVGGMIGG